MTEIRELAKQLARFSDERNWDRYHTPKNLVMALMNEVGELMEHFQWKTPEQSESLDHRTREQVRLELADVFFYLVRLADRLDVDLMEASRDKLAINARKYPPGCDFPQRPGPDVKRIYCAASLPEAHLLLHRLLEAGMPARVFNENAQGGVGELPFTHAYPEVWVERPEDEVRARDLVRRFEAAATEPTGDRVCTRCGESSPATFETCWQCAAPLGDDNP